MYLFPVGETMLPNERHEELLRLLLTHGTVEIVDISGRFGVSEMTIRRDS